MLHDQLLLESVSDLLESLVTANSVVNNRLLGRGQRILVKQGQFEQRQLELVVSCDLLCGLVNHFCTL